MGVGPLRVWNDDRVAPGTGFDPHPHRDMEIITYVRRGAVTHRDDLGNAGRTAAGDVQVMSAGTGIVHAEYNLDDEPLELFQIWIQPRRRGLKPRWAQRAFPSGERAAEESGWADINAAYLERLRAGLEKAPLVELPFVFVEEFGAAQLDELSRLLEDGIARGDVAARRRRTP